MEDSTHRKLSVELVAVLHPKNDRTKSIACQPFHPNIIVF